MQMHIPMWLDQLLGVRERAIITAPDAQITNYDADYPGSRLPSGQKHIISSVGRFTCDAKTRKIIS